MADKSKQKFWSGIFKMGINESEEVTGLFCEFLEEQQHLMKEKKLPRFNAKFLASLRMEQRVYLQNFMSELLTDKTREELDLIKFILSKR